MWQAPKSPGTRGSLGAPADPTTAVPVTGALAVWARQIENARQQTESAVTDLTVNFGDLVQKMDQSIATAQQAAAAMAKQAALDGEQAGQQLSQVLEALREMQRGRDTLTSEIGNLVSYTGELQKMAEDVKAIAFKTQMLSLNAAIEAAHAAEHGRGFAVVAHEVQVLAKASRDAGQDIHKRIGSITETLARIGEHNKAVSSQDATALRDSETRIQQVLDRQQERAQQADDAASQSRTEHNAIKTDLEDALVQLQFQDRVSQILGHVVAAMQASGAQSGAADGAGTAAAPTTDASDAALLLEQSASGYTTDEQRRIHAGLEAEVVAPREVTFF